MRKLRHYQEGALDAVYAHWKAGGVNPLVDLATGTGKSLLIAAIIQRAIAIAAYVRVLMIVHNKELVAQNAEEVARLIPGLDLGILCGNLGRYDTDSKVVFASVQSAAKRIEELGERTLVLVDEAHRVPHGALGQFGAVIGAMKAKNPKTKVVGLTASPYRLDSGRLDQGAGRLFDRVVFTYSIADGVADGYLAPLISKATALKLSTAGVGRSGGEFKAGELQAAVDQHEITAQAVSEAREWCERTGRKKTIVFAAGVEHARHVCDAMCAAGWRARVVTGELLQGDREEAIEAFKDGRADALVGVDILTTGFNVPEIDLVVMLRPTLSTGLYVQMLGRGTRPVYPEGFDQHTATLEERVAAIAASSKPDCLVLDFAGNVRRHGPVDAVAVRVEKGKASVKDHEPDEGKACPECNTMVRRNARSCPTCEYVWPGREAMHDAEADETSAVMSSEGGEWKEVRSTAFYVNKKANGTDSLKVRYHLSQGSRVDEWVCVGHPHKSMAGSRGVRWWNHVMREDPVPTKVDQAVTDRCYARARDVSVTHIAHGKDDKGYDRVKGRLVCDGKRVWMVAENCSPRPASEAEKEMSRAAYGPERTKPATEEQWESRFVSGLLAIDPLRTAEEQVFDAPAKANPAPRRAFARDPDADEIPW